MANTITISQTAYKELLARVVNVEKMLVKLLERLEREPIYGSEEWWNWAHCKGLEAKEKGEYTRLETKKDLERFFENL